MRAVEVAALLLWLRKPPCRRRHGQTSRGVVVCDGQATCCLRAPLLVLQLGLLDALQFKPCACCIHIRDIPTRCRAIRTDVHREIEVHWPLVEPLVRVRVADMDATRPDCPVGCSVKRSRAPDEVLRPTVEASLGHGTVSYTHLRAHETPEHLVCRPLLE